MRHPEDARLYAEMMAETAGARKQFSTRKAYQVLRSLNPQEFFDMWEVWNRDRNEYIHAFGPVYNKSLGKDLAGPLFSAGKNL